MTDRDHERDEAIARLRELAKQLPYDRPDTARVDAVRSALLVAATTRDVPARSRWLVVGGAFAIGAVAAAAAILLVLGTGARSSVTTSATAPGHASIEASTAADFERQITGTDEVIRVRSGRMSVAGGRVRIATGDADLAGEGRCEVVVAGDVIREVTVKEGTATLRIAHQQPVFLAAGQTWHAPIITADLPLDANVSAHADIVAPDPDTRPETGPDTRPDPGMRPVPDTGRTASTSGRPAPAMTDTAGKPDRLSMAAPRTSGAEPDHDPKAPPGTTRVDASGARPGDMSGARPGDTSGARPGDASGARSGDTSGAKRVDASGARPGDTSGAKRVDASGARPGDTSGAKRVDASGARPGETSGAKRVDASGAKPGDTSGARPGDASGAKPGGTNGAKRVDASGAMPGNNDASGATPGNANDASGAKPGGASGARPGDASGARPGDTSGAKPGSASGARPGDASGARPGDTSGAKPGDASGAKPGDANAASGTKPTQRDVERHFAAGMQLLKAGKASEAARELGAAAGASTDDPLAADARYFQAVALTRAGRKTEAEAALVAFLDHAPRSLRRGRAAVMLGRLIAERGDTASARAWFESAAHDADPEVVAAARAGLASLASAR